MKEKMIDGERRLFFKVLFTLLSAEVHNKFADRQGNIKDASGLFCLQSCEGCNLESKER